MGGLLKVLGYTDFDSKLSNGLTVVVNVGHDNIDKVYRGRYVKIVSEEGRVFLGRVGDGPYYFLEGVSSSSPIVKEFSIRGDRFIKLPPYYASYKVEIMGEVKGSRLRPSFTRPRPKSPVYEIDGVELEKILNLNGEMVLGYLIGYKGVKVKLPAHSMDFLPRNVGIFGTVGSGKSNTAQVLIEEAARLGWAVFVLDLEGEYTFMDQPSQEPAVSELESVFKLKAEGLKNFEVYVPAGRTSTRFKAIRFTIPFHEMDPYILFEIMEATEAQQRYFSKILSELKEVRRMEEADEFEKVILSTSSVGQVAYTLVDAKNKVEEKLREARASYRIASLEVILSKLERLEGYGIFDGKQVLPVADRIKKSYVTVIDLSDVEDRVRNIVISWLLYKIFKLKVSNPKLPPTMIVIEEAHAFISKEVRDKMKATIDMLKTIARRGRKRWISLVFVSQQPGHLPPEIFELCNTRIIHSLKSEYNIKALKETSGLVSEEYWRILPTLSIGEAILTSPLLIHPLLVKIRPAKTMRYKMQ